MSSNTAALEWLMFNSYWTPAPQKAWTDADERHYLVFFWNEGWSDYRTDGRQGRVRAGQGLFLSPFRPLYWRSMEPRDVVGVRVPAAVLLKEAGNLAGKPISDLEPSGMLYKQGPIWRLMHRFLQRLESGLFRKPSLLRQQWQRRLIEALVLGTPHNIPLREESVTNVPPMHALRVKLAKEYFAANVDKTIWLGDAAKTAGTSEVGLRRAFSYYNQTPWTVFEEMRMEAARRELLAPKENTSVHSVCDKYGLDPNRFPAQYLQVYREYPHETLQLGRWGRKIY